MFVRSIGILTLMGIGATMGCDFQGTCIRVGTATEFGLDHFEKIRVVSDHAKKLGLPTTKLEVAAVVGAAYAASQIEGGQAGVPVKICLRQAGKGGTEFRVLSMSGKTLSEWQSSGP
jgi:hypothetical protein